MMASKPQIAMKIHFGSPPGLGSLIASSFAFFALSGKTVKSLFHSQVLLAHFGSSVVALMRYVYSPGLNWSVPRNTGNL